MTAVPAIAPRLRPVDDDELDAFDRRTGRNVVDLEELRAERERATLQAIVADMWRDYANRNFAGVREAYRRLPTENLRDAARFLDGMADARGDAS